MVEFLNYVYTERHFNAIEPSPQLFELKKKYTLYLSYLCDMLELSSSYNAQYLHTTGHTYARLTFAVLVDNEFSSKYCCVQL